MMCNQISLLISLAFVGIFADEPEQIVNGIPTTVEENPHAVSLRKNNTHFCGGSIISPNHILTAGHCLTSLKSNPGMLSTVTIVSGTTYLDKGGDIHKIAKFFIHENYFNIGGLGRPSGYDIGLIKLTNPIRFDQHQQPVGLPEANIAENQAVTLVAWGTTKFGGSTHNDLRKLNAHSMLHDECQQRHGKIMIIHPDEFCTLIARGTGACQGDSGSGVIRNGDNAIIGLVSGGRPCAKGYPDVYTTVFPYVSWINRKMRL